MYIYIYRCCECIPPQKVNFIYFLMLLVSVFILIYKIKIYKQLIRYSISKSIPMRFRQVQFLIVATRGQHMPGNERKRLSFLFHKLNMAHEANNSV